MQNLLTNQNPVFVIVTSFHKKEFKRKMVGGGSYSPANGRYYSHMFVLFPPFFCIFMQRNFIVALYCPRALGRSSQTKKWLLREDWFGADNCVLSCA